MKTGPEKPFHIGLAFLCVWMCFEVVFVHFYVAPVGSAPIFATFAQKVARLAVPLFMLLAFYFTDPVLLASDKKAFWRRMSRLLVPHVFWSVVYWSILFFFATVGFSCAESLGWRALFGQLLTGHVFNEPMWYQVVLVVVTVLFVLAARFSASSNRLARDGLLLFVLLVSTVFVYSGLNFRVFDPLPRTDRFTLGRIAEMIPFATAGCLFRVHAAGKREASTGLFSRFSRISPAVWLFGVEAGFQLIFGSIPGFHYQHPFQLGLSALLFVLFDSVSLPFFPRFAARLVRGASNCTLGIYCVHRLVGDTALSVPVVATFRQMRPFLFCICLFSVCWTLCFLLGNMPVSFVRRSVR